MSNRCNKSPSLFFRNPSEVLSVPCYEGVTKHEVSLSTSSHGLPSDTMALITSDCGRAPEGGKRMRA